MACHESHPVCSIALFSFQMGSNQPSTEFAHRITSTTNRVCALVDSNFGLVSCMLLIANLLGCLLVINVVPYTEIDWETYMVQIRLIAEGEYDYRKVEGPTGPLVYPAGHVFVYYLLRAVTSMGSNIQLAQYIFACLHTGAMALILRIYRQTKSRVPAIVTILLFLSRRLISLFVLRLFNDAVQAPILYAAILFFSLNRWSAGCAFYSFAIALKMNALLYAPGLAVLLCQAVGFWPALIQYALSICLPIQLVLAAPFLFTDPIAYVARALELTRKFMYKWSVNGAFLDPNVFSSSSLAITLLGAHLVTLLLAAHFKWTPPNSGGLIGLLTRSLSFKTQRRRLKPTHILLVLFSSNFIGIAFARTLHYQFYTWYFHSLPFLLWAGPLPIMLKILGILAIEVVFNIYPPHSTAALVLSFVHLTILVSLFVEKRATTQSIYEEEDNASVSNSFNKKNK